MYEPWTQNLYSYVGNNPVNLTDPTGHEAITGSLLLVGAVFTAIAIAAIVMVEIAHGQTLTNDPPRVDDFVESFNDKAGKVIDWVERLFVKPSPQSIADSKAEELTKEKDEPTYIYRWGSNSLYNMTPRLGKDDETGLSFWLNPPTDDRPYVVTTMETVNSTGVLTAVNDHDTHVSVIANDPVSYQSWIATSPLLDPNLGNDPNDICKAHPYAVLMKRIVIRGGGKYGKPKLLQPK